MRQPYCLVLGPSFQILLRQIAFDKHLIRQGKLKSMEWGFANGLQESLIAT